MLVYHGDRSYLDALFRDPEMRRTRERIPQLVWESHKEIILELYGDKTLKEVQKEMQDRHDFDAR